MIPTLLTAFAICVLACWWTWFLVSRYQAPWRDAIETQKANTMMMARVADEMRQVMRERERWAIHRENQLFARVLVRSGRRIPNPPAVSPPDFSTPQDDDDTDRARGNGRTDLVEAGDV